LKVCYLKKELKLFLFIIFAITWKLWVVSKSLHLELVSLFVHYQPQHGEFKELPKKGFRIVHLSPQNRMKKA
jgi:hypothetical protein